MGTRCASPRTLPRPWVGDCKRLPAELLLRARLSRGASHFCYHATIGTGGPRPPGLRPVRTAASPGPTPSGIGATASYRCHDDSDSRTLRGWGRRPAPSSPVALSREAQISIVVTSELWHRGAPAEPESAVYLRRDRDGPEPRVDRMIRAAGAAAIYVPVNPIQLNRMQAALVIYHSISYRIIGDTIESSVMRCRCLQLLSKLTHDVGLPGHACIDAMIWHACTPRNFVPRGGRCRRAHRAALMMGGPGPVKDSSAQPGTPSMASGNGHSSDDDVL